MAEAVLVLNGKYAPLELRWYPSSSSSEKVVAAAAGTKGLLGLGVGLHLGTFGAEAMDGN